MRYALVCVWMLFTASLSLWWYLFGVEQTRRIIELEHNLSPLMSRHLHMLAWEGATLVTCVVLGGTALTYFMFREAWQRRQLQTFFSTFTHELRTPLASLRLQAESLKEDLSGLSEHRLIDRLVADTQRLTVQLENSLFLANDSSAKLLPERIELVPFLDELRQQWPTVTLRAMGNCVLLADTRALECIFRNLIQNSIVHGKASEIVMRCEPSGKQSVRLLISDNGIGFQGEPRKLGTLFSRTYAGSGNGIGLYLIKKLARRMHGDVEFLPCAGFEVALTLPGDTI